MKYAVRLDPRTWKGIERLPDDIRGRIVRRLKSLEEDPRPPGVAKLSGAESLTAFARVTGVSFMRFAIESLLWSSSVSATAGRCTADNACPSKKRKAGRTAND